MSKKKNILLIGSMPPPLGGVSVHLKRMLEHFGNDPLISFKVLDLRKGRLYRANRTEKNSINLLRAFLSADLLHIHISKKLKIAIAIAGRILGKKVFYTHHNSRDLNSYAFRWMCRICNLVILVHRAPGHHLKKNMIVLPAYLSPGAIPGLQEDIVKLFEKYDFRMVMICTGPDKEQRQVYGMEEMLEALLLIKDHSDKKILFLILDSGKKLSPRENELFEEVNSSGTIEVIYEHRSLELTSVLPHCDLFVRPTRSDGDALSVREALSAGVRVLASDVVERPKGVVVYSAENPSELSIKLFELLELENPAPVFQTDFGPELKAWYLSTFSEPIK